MITIEHHKNPKFALFDGDLLTKDEMCRALVIRDHASPVAELITKDGDLAKRISIFGARIIKMNKGKPETFEEYTLGENGVLGFGKVYATFDELVKHAYIDRANRIRGWTCYAMKVVDGEQIPVAERFKTFTHNGAYSLLEKMLSTDPSVDSFDLAMAIDRNGRRRDE